MSEEVKNEAVKEFVEGTDSAPAQTEPTDASAGTENTVEDSSSSTDSKYIPKTRFDEVINQKNEFKSKVEELENKYKAYDGYTLEDLGMAKDFYTFVENLPGGAKKLEEWVNKMSGEVSKTNTPNYSNEEEGDLSDEEKKYKELYEKMTKHDEKLRMYEEQMQKQNFEKIKQGYVSAYENLTKDENYSEADHKILKKFTQDFLYQNNKNFDKKVDHDALEKSFNSAKELLNSVKGSSSNQEVDEVPTPGTGVEGVQKPNLKDPEERKKVWMEGMKDMKF